MNNSSFNVVLQRVGDEAPITLGDEKCLIRTVLGKQRVDCCAIINGPNGTAIRSYRPGVLVNGEPTSVRQLATGDVIELPCETKIEVHQATQIQPVFSDRDRTVEDIDNELAKIQSVASNIETDPVEAVSQLPVEEPEEKFLSPFSADLPEITSESFGQPVASTVSPENRLTAEGSLAVDATPANEESAIDDQDLESIFAKLGVTNVGSIANPAVEDSTTKEPTPESVAPAPTPEEVSPVSASFTPTLMLPVQEEAQTAKPAPSVLDDTAAIRQQLEAAAVQTTEAAQPVLVTPAAAEASVPAPAPQPVAETQQQPVAVTTAPIAEPTFPEPAVVAAPQPAVAPPTPTLLGGVEDESSSLNDPLSELPADLRDQLNDLVSSLKTGAEETASQSNVPDPASTVAPMPVESSPASVEVPSMEAMAAAAAASAAATVAATIPTPAITPEPATVAPTPAPVPVQAVPTPVVPTPAAPAPVATAPTPDVPTPVQAPVPEAKENRSVADVLGAMGMAIPGDDEVESTESPTPTPAEAPQPQQPDQNVPSSPVFANMQNAAAEATPDATEGDAEEDIQAYMNRLLNRGDSPAPSQPQPQAVPMAPIPGLPGTQVQEQPPEEPVEVLSADEFVPTHKATRPENYDTLREIANTTSRTAIETSSKNVKKGGLIKIVAAVALFSFAAAAYLFMTGTLDKFADDDPADTNVEATSVQQPDASARPRAAR